MQPYEAAITVGQPGALTFTDKIRSNHSLGRRRSAQRKLCLNGLLDSVADLNLRLNMFLKQKQITLKSTVQILRRAC